MSRLGWLLALTLFLPQTSSAIQLRWSDGSSNLTFGTASRCTLIVQADPAEGALPGQWRLLWLADSSGIAFVEEDSVAACSADTARVFTIQPPATTADSAAHEITTRFCSADEAAASVAIFVLDQPGWSKGKLKVVAINPSDPDSNEVIESNEVTYNGGVEGTYPSVALAASSSHTADQFVVHATGTGLSDVVEVIAQAPDSLWSLRLQIIEQSESVLTAVAEVVASMPASVLRLSGQSGTVAVAPLAADGQREGVDPDFEALADSCRQHHCYYFDPDPNVYPKDFAFFYAIAQNPVRGLFHLFYIREFRNVPATSSSRSFGHAWSRSYCDGRAG